MDRARELLALWFGFGKRVDRRAYALTGFSLMALKFATDAALFRLLAGAAWSPLDYLGSFSQLRSSALEGAPEAVFWLLAIWTLPFVWVGASMTARRAIDAGLPAASVLLFFLPGVNYLWMLALCVAPSAGEAPGEPPASGVSPSGLADTARASALAAGVGVAFALVGVVGLEHYGATLFLGNPFVVGFAAAHWLNRERRRGLPATLAAGQTALLLVGGALLLFALEGVVCLLMAWPLAAALAALGGVLGRALAGRRPLRPAHAALLLLALPFLMGVESALSRPPLREVATAIEIDASPERVWRHVVGFGELPPPSRLVFDLGIAYPVRARLEGEGVGAVRYCEFSTGPFVEPITHWEPPRRLAFDVAEQPEPMTETSPYRRIHAAHLLDGFVSERGEFRLVALPAGRTRLEGSTWYRLDLFPHFYWAPQADALVHAIHRRVLEHVKSLAEATAAPERRAAPG